MFPMLAGRHPAIAALALLAVSLLATPVSAAPESALLVDARDGNVLFADNARAVRPPASLVKIMTLYLTFDALDAGTLSLGTRVVMSRHAAGQQPSRLGIAPGGSISVEEAIRAIVVDSANDVAVALAERIGGSEQRFATLMTDKAQALGMSDTRYANATGLTNRGNRTTAHDIATLSIAMLRHHRERYDYFATRDFRWRGRRILNHNHLLGKVAGVDGIKTGYTVDAGFNLVASARRGGNRLIAIVMGAPSLTVRDRQVAELIDRGFEGG